MDTLFKYSVHVILIRIYKVQDLLLKRVRGRALELFLRSNTPVFSPMLASDKWNYGQTCHKLPRRTLH